jgi:hypothetical protein
LESNPKRGKFVLFLGRFFFFLHPSAGWMDTIMWDAFQNTHPHPTQRTSHCVRTASLSNSDQLLASWSRRRLRSIDRMTASCSFAFTGELHQTVQQTT